MFTLYTYPITTNALKLSLLLAYLKPFLNLGIEKKIVQIHQREQAQPAFLAVNDKGQIPVLVNHETGQVITESNAILLYLANLEEVKNIPELANLGQQNDVMSWLFWQASDAGLGQSGYHFNRILLSAWGVNRPYEADEKSLAKFHKSCRLLEQHLALNSYLCGGSVSIADMAVAAPIMFYKEAKMPLSEYPNLINWLASLQESRWWSSVKLEAQQFITDLA